jgi:hypothetical protein
VGCKQLINLAGCLTGRDFKKRRRKCNAKQESRSVGPSKTGPMLLANCSPIATPDNRLRGLESVTIAISLRNAKPAGSNGYAVIDRFRAVR